MGYRTTFYYVTYEGHKHDFHTQHCYKPTATKAWRMLKKMLQDKKGIYKISYRIGDQDNI